MNRRPSGRLRAVACGLEQAALAACAAAGLTALIAGSSLCRLSPQPGLPRRPGARLGLAPVPGENRDAAGEACLKASVLLSRRARRSGDRSDEHTLLAMSHVLDALHRGGIDSSAVPPEAMLSTLTRLVDHLERLEREPRRPISGPAPGGPGRWPPPGRGEAATT